MDEHNSMEESYAEFYGCRKLVLGLLICSLVISVTIIGFAYTIPILWYSGLIAIVLLPVVLYIKKRKWIN